jgi:hypothetical protein
MMETRGLSAVTEPFLVYDEGSLRRWCLLTEEVNVGYVRPLKRLEGTSADGSVIGIEEDPDVG